MPHASIYNDDKNHDFPNGFFMVFDMSNLFEMKMRETYASVSSSRDVINVYFKISEQRQ